MIAEERIAIETEKAMTSANLKQAHERLHGYRVGVKNLRALGLPAEIASALTDLAYSIENVEWRIEKRIRDGAA